MRLVSTTRILDEADLVEAFVRHTSTYVDHQIFLDNGSSDGTIDILTNLKSEGFELTVFSNRSVYFNEMQFNTFMYNEAVRHKQAAWVLCLDCDEFIDDRSVAGGLRSVLQKHFFDRNGTSAIRIPLVEYRLTDRCDYSEVNVPKRMVHRAAVSDNTKVFLKNDLYGPDLTVGGGNHDAYVRGEKVDSLNINGLYLAHYATRTSYQFVRKYVKGWAKVLAAGEEVVNRGTSAHYKDVFGHVKNNPAALLDPSLGRVLAVAAETLEHDPIDYRGGELKYTAKTDDLWRCLRAMVGYLEDLSTQHGKLISECDDAKRLTTNLDAGISKIIG